MRLQFCVWRRDLRDDFDVFFAILGCSQLPCKVDFLGRRERNILSESETELQQEYVLEKGFVLSPVPCGFPEALAWPSEPCPSAPGLTVS